MFFNLAKCGRVQMLLIVVVSLLTCFPSSDLGLSYRGVVHMPALSLSSLTSQLYQGLYSVYSVYHSPEFIHTSAHIVLSVWQTGIAL